jgi:lipoprotein-anchoring transpeptidase ErfK/SrfK
MRTLTSAVVGLVLIAFPAAGAARASAKKTVHRKAAAPINPDSVQDASARPVSPGAAGPSVMRAQILLDRARFSPGEIDARYGDDLRIAVTGYRAANKLPATESIDSDMWKLLNADSRPLMTTYTIAEADVRGPFVPIPKDVQQQAQMKWMGYESPQEGLAEKFHVSPRLLAELNPGKTLKTAGEQLVVPDVTRGPYRRAARVVVSGSKRTVTAFDSGRKLIAQYPATMGGGHDPLPVGTWKVTVVEQNPWFFYDPAHLTWNADPQEAKAKLPPGPNNPVGVVWIGLSKPHYGIHGSPDPGHIRHGESSGCMRLTNWDAEDLAHMVRRGTPVISEK